VLIVAPEDSARTAALLSNAVDMIETPPPDAVARLKQGGMKIEQNVTPHVWNYHPSMVDGSPWTDIRLRKAANLAIDRDAIVKLLNGLARPAYGQVDKTNPWFGKPGFELKYAPDQARELTSAAGFSKAQPLKTKFVVASGGHRPDALAADERGDPGDVQGGLYRRRVQGGRARGDVHRLARRGEGRHEQGHHRQQHRLRHVRSGLCLHPLLRLEPGGAGSA
jgi:ABC-type transport system substrate-binding protein